MSQIEWRTVSFHDIADLGRRRKLLVWEAGVDHFIAFCQHPRRGEIWLGTADTRDSAKAMALVAARALGWAA
jgi:hypothetical protein